MRGEDVRKCSDILRVLISPRCVEGKTAEAFMSSCSAAAGSSESRGECIARDVERDRVSLKDNIMY